ncbi:MAG TPA: type IX secretion system protein PorQ [Bacteroidales bacterium]|nr:type IX secretion system protein PorQ [Bacteroidales bacterium]
MKKAIKFLLISVIVVLASVVNAQPAARNTYKFLTLPTSPRVAAMGGDFVGAWDHDINFAIANPALINPELNRQMSLNMVNYFSGISYGSASYGNTFNKLGSFVGTVKYIDYGSFTHTNDIGETLGTFQAGETALIIGWGRQLDSVFSIGANIKAINSSLETYNSFGFAVDVAGMMRLQNGLSVTVIASNIGRQLTSFSGINEPLPFNLQVGLSNRLQHLPFRYSILFTHLHQWDLTYHDPARTKRDPFTGEIVEEDKFSTILDGVMRHVVVGGELMPVRNIAIRFGYNYRLRQETQVDSRISTVGFSWGFGIKVHRFHFNYARKAFHLHGSPNYVSISTNLSEFF